MCVTKAIIRGLGPPTKLVCLTCLEWKGAGTSAITHVRADSKSVAHTLARSQEYAAETTEIWGFIWVTVIKFGKFEES